MEVPIALLNHQHDPADPDFCGIAEATEARIEAYRALHTEAPPSLIVYSQRNWPLKRGRGLAFVANGNHRVEAARRNGKATVKAHMPVEDYEFWTGMVLPGLASKGVSSDPPLGRS